MDVRRQNRGVKEGGRGGDERKYSREIKWEGEQVVRKKGKGSRGVKIGEGR